MNKFIFGLVVLGCIAANEAFKFPADIQRCPAGDPECMVRVSNAFLDIFAKKGHGGINLIPIDPLHIPSILIKQGAESPVNVELKFTNVDLTGLTQFRFTKMDGFKKNPVGKYVLKMNGPVLYLVGPYKISGRVLVLPIQGAGQSNITLVDPEISITFDGKSVKRNNNEYLGIENAKLTFKVSKIIFDYQNLYNGDKLLGETTNRFLNENWNDIFHEIKANIFDAFTLIIENTLRNVFNKVPHKDLFLN